jgi:hypothetical protein
MLQRVADHVVHSRLGKAGAFELRSERCTLLCVKYLPGVRDEKPQRIVSRGENFNSLSGRTRIRRTRSTEGSPAWNIGFHLAVVADAAVPPCGMAAPCCRTDRPCVHIKCRFGAAEADAH